MAKSSFSVPMVCPSGSSTTRKSNTSGIAPPFTIAFMREPLRARSFPSSVSRWISAARRPRLRGEAAREHLHHFRVFRALEAAVGIGPAHEREERRFVPFFLGGHLGHDLLREHVEGRIGHRDAVELAVGHRAHHRRALDEVVAREREDAPLGRAGDGVSRAADALQEGRDAVGRGDLADEVDVPDVDAQLERGGGHQHLELALAQPVLGAEAGLLGEAAVVRGDVVRAQALRELVRHALGQPARVHGDECRAVRLDQLDQPVVVLLPHLVGHHRLERRARHLDGEVHRALVAAVDDRARPAREEARHFLDRLLGGRKADALQLAAARVVEPLEGDRQVRAPARLQHRVDLVHDHDARGPQHLAGLLRGEEQVERLGRGDEDVRRRAQHRRALVLGRVAASHRGRDLRRRIAHRLGEGADLAARLGQVLVDVRRQRLQGRDVDHPHLVGKLALLGALAEELVERGEERGERLPRAGGRGDEGGVPAPDGGPAQGLGGGRLAEAAVPPAAEYGVEVGGEQAPSLAPFAAWGASPARARRPWRSGPSRAASCAARPRAPAATCPRSGRRRNWQGR